MSELVTKEHYKQAFRVAYDFLESHNRVLAGYEDHQELLQDFMEAVKLSGLDSLTCRVLAGVYDFICAESKKLEGEE